VVRTAAAIAVSTAVVAVTVTTSAT